jgi:histidyl-tRNA synthetase
MAAAPLITAALCDDCQSHYAQVKALLQAAGVSFIEDPRLVRGLDYYTRTVFEVQVIDGLGSQNAIGGGGRYDKVVEEFGGKPTPGLGFAVGFERIVLALQAQGLNPIKLNTPAVFVAAVDTQARQEAFALVVRLRKAGISSELDHQARSLKSQFKLADKLGCAKVVVIGSEELAGNYLTLRSMNEHSERQVASDNIISELQLS